MSAVLNRIEVLPQSGWTGAEITGVDLRKPLPEEQVDVIRRALHKWKVVYFRDQFLDHAQQIAFGRQFGQVTPGHPYEGDVAPEGFPQIHTVSPKAYEKRYGKNYTRKLSANGPGAAHKFGFRGIKREGRQPLPGSRLRTSSTSSTVSTRPRSSATRTPCSATAPTRRT